MKRVLITDACQRSALAVTRSLGRRNIHVITSDEPALALAGCSRYSQYYATYPSPASKTDAFVSAIRAICNDHNIDIVIPVTEMTTTLLLSNAGSLPGVVLPFAFLDTIECLADKIALVKSARNLDIPVPETIFMHPEDNSPLPGGLKYPLVLKPGKSWVMHNGAWHHASVRIADSESSTTKTLSNDPSFVAGPYMLQQYIPGRGAGVFAIYDRGRALAFFAHRRLREKPPRGGVSVLSESVPVDSELETIARKLLDHVGWHGVAMVEFRIAEDGTPYLMEVNTRFWGSLQLAVDAGVDFPWMLYQLAVGDQVEPVTTYRTGRRLRWLLGDLDRLYLVLRDPSFTIGEKMRACWDFVIPAPFRTKHEVNRISDMGPFWYEVRQYLRDLVR